MVVLQETCKNNSNCKVKQCKWIWAQDMLAAIWNVEKIVLTIAVKVFTDRCWFESCVKLDSGNIWEIYSNRNNGFLVRFIYRLDAVSVALYLGQLCDIPVEIICNFVNRCWHSYRHLVIPQNISILVQEKCL